MSRDEFRERVRDLVVEMAATGQTGMGFPEEYGGGGDIGASVAAFETLAFGDLSVLVKVGVQFGLFGGAILQLGTKPHHDAYLADLITGKTMGCFAMTETGHGCQRAGARHRRDVRPRDAGVRDRPPAATSPARTTSATPPSTPSSRWSSPSSRSAGSPRACTRSSSRSARRARCCPASGSRTTAGRWASTASTTAGSGSTACGCRGPRCSTSSPTSPPTASTRATIDNPNRRFFTMLGTLVQGRVCVGGAGINAAKVALAIAIEVRLQPAPVRGDLRGPGGAAPRLRHAPAPAVPAARPHLRAALRAGGRRRPAARGLLGASRRRTTRRPGASSSRGPPAPRRSAPGTRPAPSRSAARPAAVPATSR